MVAVSLSDEEYSLLAVPDGSIGLGGTAILLSAFVL
jgi:hypothetical protein